MKSVVLTAMLLAAAPAFAGSTLPVNAVTCSTLPAMEEAAEAMKRHDEQWLGSLVRCFQVTTAMDAKRLDCSGGICKVRLYAPDGQTPVMYTLRRYLN